MNVNFPNPANKIETNLKVEYNHDPLSDQAYDVLSNMERSAKMEGRWAGSILGGSMGAKYGAMIGTAIFPGPGTAIGGFAGGLILGIAGSYGGDWFAQKVIDITEVVQ